MTYVLTTLTFYHYAKHNCIVVAARRMFTKVLLNAIIIKMHYCVFKKVKLINHDCLPILMLLYIMLYIVLAYLMLFAAITNAVCFNNASFFLFLFLSLICANAFYLHALSLFIYLFLFASCTVLLICLFLLIISSHRCSCFFFIFFYERAMSSPEK